MDESDRALIRSMGQGARTFYIAKCVGRSTDSTRRALRRLEKEGLVRRDAGRSAVNDIRWLPMGEVTP